MENRILPKSEPYNRDALTVLLNAADWLSAWYWDQDNGHWESKGDKDAYAILCELAYTFIPEMLQPIAIAGKQRPLKLGDK